jgi:hypothetical protein
MIFVLEWAFLGCDYVLHNVNFAILYIITHFNKVSWQLYSRW